jgi:hypothetical protein
MEINMKREIGVCGCICSDCRIFGTECQGCLAMQGKVCWLPEVNMEICDFYECCVEQKQLTHCGECDEIPCQRFWQNKNPKWTAEQHRKIVESRVEILKKIAEKE